jgi:hypothetical protein
VSDCCVASALGLSSPKSFLLHALADSRSLRSGTVHAPVFDVECPRRPERSTFDSQHKAIVFIAKFFFEKLSGQFFIYLMRFEFEYSIF